MCPPRNAPMPLMSSIGPGLIEQRLQPLKTLCLTIARCQEIHYQEILFLPSARCQEIHYQQILFLPFKYNNLGTNWITLFSIIFVIKRIHVNLCTCVKIEVVVLGFVVIVFLNVVLLNLAQVTYYCFSASLPLLQYNYVLHKPWT